MPQYDCELQSICGFFLSPVSGQLHVSKQIVSMNEPKVLKTSKIKPVKIRYKNIPNLYIPFLFTFV